MNRMPLRLPRTDWDFSALVDDAVLRPDRKKGQKRPKEVAARQAAALSWELSREHRNGQKAWLSLTGKEREHLATRLTSPIKEVSLSDLDRVPRDSKGRPVPKSKKEFAAALLCDPYATPQPSNPLVVGEHLHILAIRWNDFGIEEILPRLKTWAQETAREFGHKKAKSTDSMAALWNLAAFRLHDKAGCGYQEIADLLFALPKFKAKRKSFDADFARKSVASGRGRSKNACPTPSWLDSLLSRTVMLSSARRSIVDVLGNVVTSTERPKNRSIKRKK